MDQQILEELKRRNSENSTYFQEQIDEYQENIDKKIEFVKQYEKKSLTKCKFTSSDK